MIIRYLVFVVDAVAINSACYHLQIWKSGIIDLGFENRGNSTTIMARKSSDPGIDVLIQTYDQAYNKTAWDGTNLRGSLRGAKLQTLIWRPGEQGHNIWEIALHCAYWKYIVWRRITGSKKGAFPRKPSDWPSPPSHHDMKVWKEDSALLDHWHQTLREEILQLSPNLLAKKPAGSKVSFMQTIYGISSHDLYHAGQIQLIKRMIRSG